MSDTTRTCLKVKNLRKKYNDENMSLKIWLEMENNVYTGRRGRIFIDKETFHYPGSIWGNPFKKGNIDEILKLYREYIEKNIKEKPDIYDISKLKGKNLGCYCDNDNKCHNDVLISIINELE